MPIGTRSIRTGPRVGLRMGLSGDSSGDGPNGNILVPMTAASFLAATGRNATHAYSCQEASGNLVDQIDSLNMVAANTPLYQQSVTGWTRKGVGFNRGTSQRFGVAAGVGPDPTTHPVTMLIYYTTRATVGANEVLNIAESGGTSCRAMDAAGILTTQCVGASNAGTVDHRDGNVHPLLFTYDQGNSTVNRYTDLERDDGTFAAGVVDGLKAIGAGVAQNSWLGECLAWWILENADAQFTAAQAKSFLQSLGWTIPWS